MIYTPRQVHRVYRQRLFIDGQEYQMDAQASLSRDINDFRATCDVLLIDTPSVSISFKPFCLDMQWYGKWHRVFTGFTLPRSASAPAIQRSVLATDILYYLDTYPDEDIVWKGRSYIDAVRDLLYAAKIPSSRISLPSSTSLGTRNIIGQKEEIVVSGRDNIQQVMRKLMDFGRYRLYCDRNGIVRMSKYSTVPANHADIFFSTDNVLDTEYGIYSIMNEIGKDERIVNRYIVLGHSSQSHEQPTASWSTTAVDGITRTENNDFCQSYEQCAELAKEAGQSECRQELLWNITLPPDPTLEIGTCIMMKSSLVGVPLFKPGRIIRHQYNGIEMKITVSYNPRAIGGLDNGGEGLQEDGYDPPAPPIASFSVQIEHEGNVYGLFLDGSASSSDTSSIVSYTWEIQGCGEGFPSPALSGKDKQLVVVDTIDGVTVKLTVTDANGASGTATQILSSQEEILTRYLQSIVNNRWYVLLDWSVGWIDITPIGKTPTVCVHRSDTQYFFCGMSDGSVYRYDVEKSDTYPIPVAKAEQGITAISQGEVFASLESGNTVAFGAGNTLFLSKNALSETPNWTQKNLPASITCIEINAYEPTNIKVCYGNTHAISYDFGETFEIVYTSDAGAIPVGLASFPWDKTYATIWRQAPSDEYKLLPYGGSINWGALAGLEPTNLTPGLTEELLYITDENDHVIVVEDTVATAMSLSGGVLTNIKAIERDGEYNDIVYFADNSIGIGKIVGKTRIFPLSLAGAGKDVGYGILRSNKSTPPIPALPAIILLPFGKTGEKDFIHIYRLGRWEKITPPSAGRKWFQLDVTADGTWWLSGVGDSDGLGYPAILAQSTDKGATWRTTTIGMGYNNNVRVVGKVIYHAGTNKTYVVYRQYTISQYVHYYVCIATINPSDMSKTVLVTFGHRFNPNPGYDAFFDGNDTIVIRALNPASSVYRQTFILRYTISTNELIWGTFNYIYYKESINNDFGYGYHDAVFDGTEYLFMARNPLNGPTITKGNYATITLPELQKNGPQGHSLVSLGGMYYVVRGYSQSYGVHFFAGVFRYANWDEFPSSGNPIPNWYNLNDIGLGTITINGTLAAMDDKLAFIDATNSKIHSFTGGRWDILNFPDGITSSDVAKFVAIIKV